VTITIEDDPTPLVLMLATTLRRSVAARPKMAAGVRGIAAVCSMNDAQAVTFRLDRGDISIEHGKAADAGLVITIDLGLDGLPGAPPPKVVGALRHPRLALAMSKLLDPPLPPWQESVEVFWRAARDRPHMPTGLTVTDGDGMVHSVGEADGDEYLLYGPADRLAKVFVGSAFVLEEVGEGRMHGRGAMSAGVALTRSGLELGLGRLGDPA
jgi:hypothetical protein